jgi:hypothetical protein
LAAGRVFQDANSFSKGKSKRGANHRRRFLSDALWREGRRAKWTGMFQRTEGFKKTEADRIGRHQPRYVFCLDSYYMKN